MRGASLCLLPLLALALNACGDSESAKSGLGQPLQVSGGQFFDGSFPASHVGAPEISSLNIRSLDFLQGTPGKTVTGLAGPGSQSVALALQGMGSGFWIVPVGGEDLDTPGSFDWGATMNFSNEVPVGPVKLQVAASDPNGNFGPLDTQTLNIKSLLPTVHVVATLTWGADVDLDLHLVGPSGKELDPKHPNSSPLDDTGSAVAGSGLLTHDSLAACVPDGLRTENVVWSDAPEAGTYTVRVDMFSACGKPAASFKFNLYVDGKSVLEKTGRMLDIDADAGGAGSGLFVTQFSCDEGTGTCS